MEDYLENIIFGDFSNMAIRQRINLSISNIEISKGWEVLIWRRLILTNFKFANFTK